MLGSRCPKGTRSGSSDSQTELDAFTCWREAVGRSPEERGRSRAFLILELGGLCPNVAPADGEITHGCQLQQERVVKCGIRVLS